MTRRLTAVPASVQWHDGLPIYASEAFLKTESDFYGWIEGLDDGGNRCCLLPYTVIRKPGLHMVRFKTETIPLLGEFDIEDERTFLNSAVEHFRSTSADLILPSGNSAVFRTYPDGASAAPYGTVIKELSQPEESLWSEMRPTHRQNIRKAEQAGVQIRIGLNYVDVCYRVIAETLRRSGAKFAAYDAFKRRILSLGENVEAFVAEKNGVVQGCMVAPFSRHTAYDCYAGSRFDAVRGAMPMLHWQAIRHFRTMGIRFFDFQGLRINPQKGSKQDGIASYKRGFGGRVVQGYLWKCPLRPLKFAGYSFAVRLLMGGDIVDQERHNLVVA